MPARTSCSLRRKAVMYWARSCSTVLMESTNVPLGRGKRLTRRVIWDGSGGWLEDGRLGVGCSASLRARDIKQKLVRYGPRDCPPDWEMGYPLTY
ncbi:unnamed protein product [Mycena citricolor]|uniref:Uncharacterized protein n=1 Tax=Mycena citricolor TaxID=2018698 RepID=A0AAD2HK42_9AGAR|nr:unnamed protein product [Mycena citricolor]